MRILIELIQLGRIEVKKTPNAVEGLLTDKRILVTSISSATYLNTTRANRLPAQLDLVKAIKPKQHLFLQRQELQMKQQWLCRHFPLSYLFRSGFHSFGQDSLRRSSSFIRIWWRKGRRKKSYLSKPQALGESLSDPGSMIKEFE